MFLIVWVGISPMLPTSCTMYSGTPADPRPGPDDEAAHACLYTGTLVAACPDTPEGEDLATDIFGSVDLDIPVFA